MPVPLLEEVAPAKVNLTLRVLGRRADGYHELESLVVFADVADRLALAPGRGLALAVRGPNAAQAGADADNLVLKAANALAGLIPGLTLGRVRAGEEAAGRGRDRRRFDRCGGGAAAARRGPTISPAMIRASTRRRARPAPMCRSASIRARA